MTIKSIITMSTFEKSLCGIGKMQHPNHPYQECPRTKCFNCDCYGHNNWNFNKLVWVKCQKPGHYSFECDNFHPKLLIMAHPARTLETFPTYSHPSRVPICSSEPAPLPPTRPGSVNNVVMPSERSCRTTLQTLKSSRAQRDWLPSQLSARHCQC